MARYKLILAYDGTEFFGSQRQSDERTVQSVLEAALRKLDWQGTSILLAGRTDRGVHASGQVAAFDLDWNHPPETLLRALNANLPPDVAARRISAAASAFHPRFDAVSRTYRYEIFCDPVRNPLRERYAWRVDPAPAFDRLQACAAELVGKHDFAAFGTPPRPGGGTVREVTRAAWVQNGDRLTFTVTANAFLYHMVRRMVFVQVAAGQGSLEVGSISRSLDQPEPPSIFQGLAPPQGLTLIEVGYPPKNTGENG